MEEQITFHAVLANLTALLFIALGIFVKWFLQNSKNAPLKRRVFRWSLVLMGPLVIGFFWAANAPLHITLAMISGVGIVALMNLRMVRFCDSCGQTLVSYNLIFRHKFCSNCGATLKQ